MEILARHTRRRQKFRVGLEASGQLTLRTSPHSLSITFHSYLDHQNWIVGIVLSTESWDRLNSFKPPLPSLSSIPQPE